MTLWDEIGRGICHINDQIFIKTSCHHPQLPNQGLHASVPLCLSGTFYYFSLSEYARVHFPDQRREKHMCLLHCFFLSAFWTSKPKATSYWRLWIFYPSESLSEWMEQKHFPHSISPHDKASSGDCYLIEK